MLPTTLFTEYLVRLRDKISEHFDENELRDLCFQLGLDYADLTGEGRAGKIRELVTFWERRGRIGELVAKCRELRPRAYWEEMPPPGNYPEPPSTTLRSLSSRQAGAQDAHSASAQPARLFICYKRHAAVDQQLALCLRETLTAQGHTVFIDQTMRAGDEWLDQIDRQIRASDFLIVLLSPESADSEMVRAEVHRAYEHRQQQGKPRALPVRIAYEGVLPYALAAFLDPLQYVVWHSEADNARVAQEIAAAIAGQLPPQTPTPLGLGRAAILSEDGRPVADDQTPHPPLPEFDPRFVQELIAPGGAVKLRDKLYVERDADARLKQHLVQWGSTVTLRAPRQTGKTSLLMRGVQHARDQGQAVVFFDFQGGGRDPLASLETLLRELAESVCDELGLDEETLARAWAGARSAPKKLLRFMEKDVLPTLDKPMVLAIDEADCLLQTNFYRDFFAMLRSWHNRRAARPEWEKLNMVLVISTEPYLLIDDVNQSPFNVGYNLSLADFDAAQVRELNRRHGSPVSENDLPRLLALLRGHPYLTRRALYALAAERLPWAELLAAAPTDQGPFGSHLLHQYWGVRDKPELKHALREIISAGKCADEMALFRLLQAGLVRGSGESYTCRCGLYEQYFRTGLSPKTTPEQRQMR